MKTASSDELMAKCLQRSFKPRTRLNTHQWAAKNIRLDQRFTARPGYYDVNFTPYMRGPHEWFSDPYVEEITGAKSRQVGGTTYLANCMMFAVGEDPGPSLYVTSTIDNAKSFSDREWTPRVDLSPSLVELKPDNDDDYKKLEQHFKTCTVKFTGSNSPANLMSRAIRYLFEDEIDTWPEDNGAEAPSIEIVEACTLSYGHAKKILRISTPTVPTGAIWTNFLRGTMHKYHVPCPHCKDRFEFKFEQLNFHRDECRNDRGVWNLDKVREITSLTCPCCKQDIKQKQQTKMVHDGIWVQTNHEAPKRHISWHISALYSPTISWGQIAVLFLQKKDTPGGLHDFYNHYLGLPFTREATSVTITDIENVVKASPSYHLFNIKSADKYVLPCQAEFIVMGVDVQQDTFWWGQRALDLSESSYLIDYGQASSWDDLTELRERYYTQPDGTKIQVWKAFIDSGYRATRQSGVYNHCIKSGGYFIPCQGRSMVHGLFQPIRETEFEYRDYLIPAVQLRDDLYKEQLYIQKIKERAGSPWWLPQNLDEAYKKQLTDEKLEVKRNERGTDVMEWVTKGNNHLGDVEKYILGGIDLVVPYVRAKRNGTLVKANDEKGEFYQVLETLKEERKEEQLVIDPFANTW